MALPRGHGISFSQLDADVRGFKENSYVELPGKCLSTIMRELGHSHLDILKLDVEGAEEVVIRTLNLTSDGFPFSVVMVEADRWDRAKNARVDQLLLGAGLVQLPISASPGSYNHLFARPQLADSRPPHLHIKSLLQNYSRYVHAHGLLPAPDSCGAPSCMPTALGRSNASYFVSQLPGGLPGIHLDS